MASFEFIEFQRERDFSNKMNATFTFIKQNFKPLIKTIFFLVGPPALVTCLLFGTVFGKYFQLAFGSIGPGGSGEFQSYVFSVEFWSSIVLGMLVAAITTVMITASVNNYVILYRKKRSNEITVEEVWERVRETFMNYFFLMLGYFVLLAIVMTVLMVVAVGISTASPVLGGFLIFALFLFLFYLIVATSLIFSIKGFENKGLMEALSRSISLTYGKWWSTFGLMFILSFIVSIVCYVFMLPAYVTMVLGVLHNIKAGSEPDMSGSGSSFMMISMGLYYMAYFVLSALPQIGLIFQYFNLVERKESRGLMEKMGALGSSEPQQSSGQEEHF